MRGGFNTIISGWPFKYYVDVTDLALEESERNNPPYHRLYLEECSTLNFVLNIMFAVAFVASVGCLCEYIIRRRERIVR